MRFTLLLRKGRDRVGDAEGGRAAEDPRACGMRRLNINVDGESTVSSEWPITAYFLQAHDFAAAGKLAKFASPHIRERAPRPPPAWPALRARACGCFYVNGGEAC